MPDRVGKGWEGGGTTQVGRVCATRQHRLPARHHPPAPLAAAVPSRPWHAPPHPTHLSVLAPQLLSGYYVRRGLAAFRGRRGRARRRRRAALQERGRGQGLLPSRAAGQGGRQRACACGSGAIRGTGEGAHRGAAPHVAVAQLLLGLSQQVARQHRVARPLLHRAGQPDALVVLPQAMHTHLAIVVAHRVPAVAGGGGRGGRVARCIAGGQGSSASWVAPLSLARPPPPNWEKCSSSRGQQQRPPPPLAHSVDTGS